MSYTVVFKGNARDLPFNPLSKNDTPFGDVEAVSIGDAQEYIQNLEHEAARLRILFERIDELATEMMTGRSSYVGLIRDIARKGLGEQEIK